MRYRITNRADGFLHVIRNFDVELFLEGHDQFDQVQRVSAQIIDEACAFDDFVTIHVEIIDNNFFNA